MDFDTLITSLSAAVLAAKLSLLFVEAQNKVMYFSAVDTDRPPQETSGILSRSVFWWINSLFFHGMLTNLSQSRAEKLILDRTSWYIKTG